MGVEPLLRYSTLFGFLFTLARISGVFAFLPLSVYRAAPEPARIVLAIAVTLILRPEWKAPVGAELSIGRVLAGVAGESALGLAIGISLAIVIEVFKMAAQAVSMSAGLGYASTVDPTSGADSTVLLTTAELVAGLLFFVSGADRVLIRVLADSMRLCPPESFVLNHNLAPAITGFAASIFSAGLRLAAPLIALLLLADVSLAVLGRMQSQLHLVSLTMPVKLAATMLLLSATIILQPNYFEDLMLSWTHLVEGIFRSLH